MTWTERLWLLFTGLGLVVAVFVLNTSLVNWILLRHMGINSVRRYLAATEVLKNGSRLAVQAIFVGVGIYAASQPNPPHQVTTAEIIFSGAFILAAALLAASSVVDLVRFRHVLEVLKDEPH